MIICILKSDIFTIDPDIRFSKEYNVPIGTWRELWRKYKLLAYEESDLRDLYFLKTGRYASRNMIPRWKWRTEVYSKTKPLLEKGTQAVQSSFFGEYEERVIKEVLKNMSTSVHKTNKVLI
jgi:hypothetical protein